MSEPDYDVVHAKRFEESLKWIAPYAEKAEKILELGGATRFTAMVLERWQEKLVPHYGGDLRQGFLVTDCDLVLCMEVIEHVLECEHESIQDTWMGTGVHNVLESCWMSLRPGGHLFLTTPNACSITAIHHALELEPPMVYRPHVREYVPFEVDEMVRMVGFEIVRRETLDVWRNALSDRQWTAIRDFIKRAGYPNEPGLRGEDLFMLAKKPEKTTTVT